MVILSWCLFCLVLITLLVWLWINYGGGYGKSLRYALSADAPDAAPPPGGWPKVAVLSPGRNEAEHLPTVLPELCSQTYPHYQVVFIDDASTDATADITAEMVGLYPHLTVLRNEQEPPAGWIGKCWAVHRGYQQVADDTQWLCFTDADIHWRPELLQAAIRYALDHDAELVGLTPTLVFGSALESIVQLQLVLALGIAVPFEKAMDPDQPHALTSGAFTLVKRSAYDQVGGHEAVKGEMVDDIKLGVAIKAAGAKHRVAMAGELMSCRMYEDWADMWEGLTKNAYAGTGHRWWLALPLALLVLVLNVLPPVYVIASLVWMLVSPGWMSAVTFGTSLASVLLIARALNTARRLMEQPPWLAWTMSIGSGIYVAIILASMVQYHTGGNAWKGRRYRSTA